MRPALLALSLLLVAAGCVTPDGRLTAASADEAAAPAPTASTPAEPTPQPIPTAPTQPTPPPANQTANATAPASEPPAPPARPPDHHAEQEGWIALAPPATSMRVTLPVPVQEGARNVTLAVRAFAVTPGGALPAAPANVTASLLAPDGTVLATAQGGLNDPTVTLDLVAPGRVGEFTAVLDLVGVSDGAQAGDKYRAVIHVAY